MKYPEKKLSSLLNHPIYDASGEKIGKLIDAIFKSDGSHLLLTKFVVGGSIMEEFLEKIKLKKDIDPVFMVESIEKIDQDRINLNRAGDELKSTHVDDDAIEGDEYKFSQLKKFKVFDPEDNHIGNLIDLRFKEDQVEFILGDGFFRELIEDLGLAEDLDFIVSPELITKIQDDHIHISKKKDELQEIITTYKRDTDIFQSMYIHPYMM